MNTYHFQRRGTAAEWTAANPVLVSGELGFETDTVSWKVGDGATAWNSLPYILGRAELVSNITWDDGSTNNTMDLSTATIPTANHFVIQGLTDARTLSYITNAPDHPFKISLDPANSYHSMTVMWVDGTANGSIKPEYLGTGAYTLYDMNAYSGSTSDWVVLKKTSYGTFDVIERYLHYQD